MLPPTHGIFVKQYLHGAAAETIAETQELAAGPAGILQA